MEKQQRYIDMLVSRYPVLEKVKCDIERAYFVLEKCYKIGGKLLVAGNGGSAADAEHIAAELMKGFMLSRPISVDFARKLIRVDPIRGEKLSKELQNALEVIPLVSQEALNLAYMNDVDSQGIFAQQLLGYGKKGDVFLGISTSGNSENILNAAVVAKALEIQVVALTGEGGGTLADYSDVTIKVPERTTYMIQELHLPIYHCLCLMLEENFFGGMAE